MFDKVGSLSLDLLRLGTFMVNFFQYGTNQFISCQCGMDSRQIIYCSRNGLRLAVHSRYHWGVGKFNLYLVSFIAMVYDLPFISE